MDIWANWKVWGLVCQKVLPFGQQTFDIKGYWQLCGQSDYFSKT
jgi:hypothetical protein